jgi:hypothetical protein
MKYVRISNTSPRAQFFNCQTHIPFHGGVITVRVESLRLVELQDSLFRDEWILRLALLHDDIKYYKTYEGHTQNADGRMGLLAR